METLQSKNNAATSGPQKWASALHRSVRLTLGVPTEVLPRPPAGLSEAAGHQQNIELRRFGDTHFRASRFAPGFAPGCPAPADSFSLSQECFSLGFATALRRAGEVDLIEPRKNQSADCQMVALGCGLVSV